MQDSDLFIVCVGRGGGVLGGKIICLLAYITLHYKQHIQVELTIIKSGA